MTREEAKGNLIHAIRWNDMPKKEALDMAIKALEQELIFEEIKAEALSLKINYTDYERDAYRRGVNDVLKIIDEIIAKVKEQEE